MLRVPGSPVMPRPRRGSTRGSPGRVATPAAAPPPPRHAAFSLAAALLSKVSLGGRLGPNYHSIGHGRCA